MIKFLIKIDIDIYNFIENNIYLFLKFDSINLIYLLLIDSILFINLINFY